jgi:hypothetical protein
MIIRICDRCGKRVTQDITKYASVIQFCKRLHVNCLDVETMSSYELCEDCIRHIVRWIDDEKD